MPRAPHSQLPLPFSSVRNSGLLSNHWLTSRLQLEPEWRELREAAIAALVVVTDLWRVQRTRVEHYGSEQALEHALIQPVLAALSWKLIYQTHLRGRRPDYALYEDDQALERSLREGHLSPSFWEHPTIVADAKAWGVPLDRPRVVNQQREYPPEQIEWYLSNSRLPYAILTNGRIWRLVPREYESGQPRFQTYLECDLARILDDRLAHEAVLPEVWGDFEDFLRFFLFFSPFAHTRRLDRLPLIDRARRGSTEYRLGVGEGLKQRVFDALSLSIEGFLTYAPNELHPDRHMQECRENSFILLYRLLFILYAEDRRLLPYGEDRLYTRNRSLGRLRDDIGTRLDRIEIGREPDYNPHECSIWADLTALFDLINEGASRYRVPPYDGGLFDPQQSVFLREKRLPDRYLARIIDQLARSADPANPDLGLVRVDYRDLAIQHLGNVYEGLLELRPHYAVEDMVVIRRRALPRTQEFVVRGADPIERGFEPTGKEYRAGSVYLLTDKGERRASGSYYTPNHVVDEIVEATLGPLCEMLDRHLTAEIEATAGSPHEQPDADRLEQLRTDFDHRVLRLRVLDPAIGSGHFLIRVAQFLAEQIATNPHTASPPSEHLEGDEPTLTYWKRKVAETCLYGVDKNPLASKLAVCPHFPH